MNILLLAPQPFFQVRGTPIATRLLIETLAREGHHIHVLTFHEGRDVQTENCTIQRIPRLPFVREIPPGFSWRKLLCDLVMLVVVLRTFRSKSWDVVHAVEESVFIAWLVKKIWRTPYVYDMDSSLPEQMCAAYRVLKPFEPVARRVEGGAIAGSIGVLTVCQALEALANSHAPKKTVARIEDVSLAACNGQAGKPRLKQLDGRILMYVGNLQRYQGIDLLLEAFSLLVRRQSDCRLVILGGAAHEINSYEQFAKTLGIAHRTHFLGACPVEHLMSYLRRADVLVSPRLSGTNTPMKIFSYLDSGTPIVATRQLTHTQVLDDRVACLVDANPHSMAQGMDRILINPTLGQALARRARDRSRQEFRADVAARKLIDFYQQIERELTAQRTEENLQRPEVERSGFPLPEGAGGLTMPGCQRDSSATNPTLKADSSL